MTFQKGLEMNDFKKEELQRICEFFNAAIQDYQEPDGTYHLRDKIQTIINNYDAKVVPAWHCEKCGHVQ